MHGPTTSAQAGVQSGHHGDFCYFNNLLIVSNYLVIGLGMPAVVKKKGWSLAVLLM